MTDNDLIDHALTTRYETTPTVTSKSTAVLAYPETTCDRH